MRDAPRVAHEGTMGSNDDSNREWWQVELTRVPLEQSGRQRGSQSAGNDATGTSLSRHQVELPDGFRLRFAAPEPRRPSFVEALDYVLQKNAELYRRLA